MDRNDEIILQVLSENPDGIDFVGFTKRIVDFSDWQDEYVEWIDSRFTDLFERGLITKRFVMFGSEPRLVYSIAPVAQSDEPDAVEAETPAEAQTNTETEQAATRFYPGVGFFPRNMPESVRLEMIERLEKRKLNEVQQAFNGFIDNCEYGEGQSTSSWLMGFKTPRILIQTYPDIANRAFAILNNENRWVTELQVEALKSLLAELS